MRVIAPFIGGGFGPKIMMFYPEEVLIPWAAMRLGRPVKWIEDRARAFLRHHPRARPDPRRRDRARRATGRILGVKDVFLHDTGAYDPYGLTVPINSQCTLLGPYVVPNYDSTFTAVFTNKPIVTPYRGAGRQHGVFVMERLLDIAARELGLDRVEIRRRNFIPPRRLSLRQRDHLPGLRAARVRQRQLRADARQGARADRLRALPCARSSRACAREGRHVGIGVVCYVEGTGIGPYEGAKVQVQASGKVSVATGIGTQGQGHYTSFAQIVADQVGVDVRDVDVVTGDTDQFYWGAGTFASRGAVVAGNAVHAAAKVVRQKILHTAAEHFECAEEDLVIEDGTVSIVGVPGRSVTLGELAAHGQSDARRGRSPAPSPAWRRRATSARRCGATASGVHAMIVEVDPETMMLEIKTLRRGARLRHGDQPADPRGPDPRRRGAGHRQRLLRAARVRRATASCSTPRSPTTCCRPRSTCRGWSSATP